MDFEVLTGYVSRKGCTIPMDCVIRTDFVDPMDCVDQRRTWQLETCGPDEPGSFVCTFGQ